ncbi:MAG: pSer/pThr/pTyr-binding forkhead associated (FHA) protein, partial [Myxococcota bacterium]
MPHLLLSQGDRPLLTHMLRPGRTVIGRSDRSDIALPSNALSRTHCTVEQRPEGWLLTDRSRHGITVNNIAAERYWLEDGDVVKLG